jgi:hypothetical protein
VQRLLRATRGCVCEDERTAARAADRGIQHLANNHRVVRQHPARNGRHAIEDIPDVEHPGDRIEQFVESEESVVQLLLGHARVPVCRRGPSGSSAIAPGDIP